MKKGGRDILIRRVSVTLASMSIILGWIERKWLEFFMIIHQDIRS